MEHLNLNGTHARDIIYGGVHGGGISYGGGRSGGKRRTLFADSEGQAKRLTIQAPDRPVFGPVQEDGSRKVYWGGECRGTLLKQEDGNEGSTLPR